MQTFSESPDRHAMNLKTRLYRPAKITALLVMGLALVFWLFFDRSKHDPILSAALTFGDDPFDAVGSFGIQLALFAGLLSLWRVFRPHFDRYTQSNLQNLPDSQTPSEVMLQSSSEIVALSAIAVTLAADTIAMLRNPALAFDSPACWLLALWAAGLALATLLSGWWVYLQFITASRANDDAGVVTVRRPWLRAVVTLPLSILILAVYPPQWDQGSGVIFSALLGMALLFANVWAAATVSFPGRLANYPDLLDDFILLYRWLKLRALFAGGIFLHLEQWMARAWVRRLAGWFDPRRHAWRLVPLFALGMGSLVFLGEALGEGAFPAAGRFLMVAAVFIGIEGAGVLLGYALLAPFLGVFQRSF